MFVGISFVFSSKPQPLSILITYNILKIKIYYCKLANICIKLPNNNKIACCHNYSKHYKSQIISLTNCKYNVLFSIIYIIMEMRQTKSKQSQLSLNFPSIIYKPHTYVLWGSIAIKMKG